MRTNLKLKYAKRSKFLNHIGDLKRRKALTIEVKAPCAVQKTSKQNKGLKIFL